MTKRHIAATLGAFAAFVAPVGVDATISSARASSAHAVAASTKKCRTRYVKRDGKCVLSTRNPDRQSKEKEEKAKKRAERQAQKKKEAEARNKIAEEEIDRMEE